MTDFKKTRKYFLPENRNIETASMLLEKYLHNNRKNRSFNSNKNWGVICIGTDRMTGDCLGPMVGSRLFSLCPVSLTDSPQLFPVYGTLKQPIHAMNLLKVIPDIKKTHPHHSFIVVDATVGPKKNIGKVSITPGPLCPGEGLGKSLPSIGNISVTGIVGAVDDVPELTLPYTRLYRVDLLAEFISLCIWKCISRNLA